MDYSKILYTDNMIFPNTFKVIVNPDNFESVQRLLFMAGMRWTFSGQDVIPYNFSVEFSFLHIGRNSPGVIQMFHRRDLFDSLNIPELIMSNITNSEIKEKIALKHNEIDILYNELVKAKFGTYHYYTEKIQQHQKEIELLKKQLISESETILVNS